VATSSLSARHILTLFAVAASAAILAGCSGSPSSPVTPMGATQPASMLGTPFVKNDCPAHGGVRVDPCKVTFTASSPGPDTVIVRAPEGKKGFLVEKDDCGGASGIATVTQGSGDSWTVTAGAMTGVCKAMFRYHNGAHDKVVGHARLRITNKV